MDYQVTQHVYIRIIVMAYARVCSKTFAGWATESTSGTQQCQPLNVRIFYFLQEG